MHSLKGPDVFVRKKYIPKPYPLKNGGGTSANPIHHIEDHETTEGCKNVGWGREMKREIKFTLYSGFFFSSWKRMCLCWPTQCSCKQAVWLYQPRDCWKNRQCDTENTGHTQGHHPNLKRKNDWWLRILSIWNITNTKCECVVAWKNPLQQRCGNKICIHLPDSYLIICMINGFVVCKWTLVCMYRYRRVLSRMWTA